MNKSSDFYKKYGGYWRYPDLIDFCYLVNPYYPTPEIINLFKNYIDKLVTCYPSGISVIESLASEIFEVNKNFISIGNGSSEIIRSIASIFSGSFGIIKPTFDEYFNRIKSKKIVLNIINENFSYSDKDIIEFFTKNVVNNIIIVNPDMPTGNYIKKDNILNLITFFKNKNVNVIVDESFIDFSEEDDCSLINDSILKAFNNLYVVKSLSKSYGIPGLRIGFIFSSNNLMISKIRKDLPIWNINSFAEFWLQNAIKYKIEYRDSIKMIKKERDFVINNLLKIQHLRIFPSQGNYLMMQLLGKIKSSDLSNLMLNNYNILIRDLSFKINNNNQYIRISIRSREDNIKLINAIYEIFSHEKI